MTVNEEENLNIRTKVLSILIDIINPNNISAITLHVNGLNVVIKRQSLPCEFLKTCRRHSKDEEIKVSKIKRWKNISCKY